MPITLPPLPYAYDALEPKISAETLEYHHGKHHKKYVDTLNKLIAGTEFEKMELEEIIRTTAPPQSDDMRKKIFNNAAQAWNHTFYWNCLAPDVQNIPATLAKAIAKDFGDAETLKQKLHTAAMEQFGSGWAWLAYDSTTQKLSIVKTSNAETPLAQNQFPLLTVDVWEHAYYLDYQNKREDYLEAVIENLINWDFVAKCYESALKGQQAAA